MLEKAQVHMLPTKPSTYTNTQGMLVKCTKEQPRIGEEPVKVGTITISKNWSFGVLKYWEPQYLYFTTDEEIKKDEWIFNEKYGISKCQGQNMLVAHDRKIAATTNPELWESHPGECIRCIVTGKIPLDFVEAYVKSQGSIKEVMLECEEGGEFYRDGYNQRHPDRLKLRSNGSVIVHPVKEELYTLQQISDLLGDGAYDNYLNYLIDNNKCTDKESKNYYSFKQWFKQNYSQ